MRYRTRRAAWQTWAWFWGLLFAMFWPAVLPFSNTGKTMAVAVWLAVAVPAAVIVRVRRRRVR